MEIPRKSRLFYKARERIIEEIATQMVCERIDIEGDDGLPMPQSWVDEAHQRMETLLTELSDESLREDEAHGFVRDRKPRKIDS
jgi:hypothetical protein